MTEEQVAELIDLVFRKGAYLKKNQRTVRRLAKLGRPALDALLKILKRPPKFEMDPRDFPDSVGSFLSAIARTAPDAVVDRLDDLLNEGSTWLYVYDALGNAKGQRSLDALIAGLKDDSQYARDAAARALVKRKSKKAVLALIEAYHVEFALLLLPFPLNPVGFAFLGVILSEGFRVLPSDFPT